MAKFTQNNIIKNNYNKNRDIDLNKQKIIIKKIYRNKIKKVYNKKFINI